MTRSYTIAYWEEVLWCDLKLSQVLFGREIVLEEVTDLRFLHLLDLCLTDTDLNRVNAVFLNSLDLCDLTAIKLNNSARLKRAPLVPEVCATDLVAQRADTSTFSVRGFSWLDLELSVNLLLKALECFHLVSLAVLSGLSDSLVIKTALFGEG